MPVIHEPLHVSVIVASDDQLRGVYGVLASRAALAAALAVLDGAGSGNLSAPVGNDAKPATPKPSATVETPAPESPVSDGIGETATSDASLSDGVVDAHGWPWSEDLHASTKTQTKEGLWRMKVGVTRPDPKPGFPVNGTGTKNDGPALDAGDTVTAAPAVVDEDDEFAAFTKANAEAEAAPVEVPARTWADADLSSLCAQAATKLGGDPTKVKEIIARFTPDGETPHSRNVPADDREAFALEIEKLAGITYAG